jgi:hypothetical protein
MYIIARLNYSADTSSVSFKTFHSKCYTTKEEAEAVAKETTLRTGTAHSVLFVYNTFDVVENISKRKGV